MEAQAKGDYLPLHGESSDIGEAKCLATHAIAYQGLFTTVGWSTLCTYESSVGLYIQ